MEQVVEVKSRKPFPFFTLAIIALSLGMYVYVKILFGGGKIPDEYYSYLGAPFAADVYLGEYWGIVTNNFLHIYWFHLLINVVLVFSFSAYIERRISFFRLFFLGLIVAAISSSAQLFITEDPGIGLDGVNYGLFGFILIRRFFDHRFRKFPIYLVSLLMIMLISFCYYVSTHHQWKFEFTAMISGFFAGIFVALLYFRPLFYPVFGIIAIYVGFATINLVYAPWSAMWNFAQGVKFHEKGDAKKAAEFYNKSLEIDPNYKLALENMKLLRIDELSDQAFIAHSNGDYFEARRLYKEIFALDKNNEWARNNYNKLP